MSEQIRILAVLTSNKIGGVQRRALAIAKKLRDDCYGETVFMVPNEPGSFCDSAQREGFECFAIDFPRPTSSGSKWRQVGVNIKYAMSIPLSLGITKRLIESMDVDIVHVNGLLGIPIVIAAKMVRKKIAWHLIGTVYPGWLIKILSPFYSRVADAIVLVADSLRHYYRIEPTLVIREPVSDIFLSTPHNRDGSREYIKKAFGVPTDAVLIVSIGNINPAKGFEYLISSLSELIRSGLPLHGLIVGDTSESNREYANKLVRSIPADVRERIHFTGFIENVIQILDGADIYVQSSVQEGTPIAILEAMARSLPVVATRVGGIQEQIDHMKTGVLIPPRSSSHVARAITTLLSDCTLMTEIGSNARRRVEDSYTLTSCAQKHVQLYARVLGGAHNVL